MNYVAMVAEAWERALALTSYGTEPLTIGWWRGEAFVHLWDYRKGHMTWRPLRTTRAPQPLPSPPRDIFNTSALLKLLG